MDQDSIHFGLGPQIVTLQCIFYFPTQKGSFSLSCVHIFFFHFLLDFFYEVYRPIVLLLTNSYVFLDANIFFIILFATLKTFNVVDQIWEKIILYYVYILCYCQVLIDLENSEIVWTI